MLVIPAVDVKNGRCVRLYKGLKHRETVYADDPVRAAERWTRYPVRRVHVIDLDGAFDGRPRNMDAILAIIRLLCEKGIDCEVGGGVRSLDVVSEYAAAGAARVIIGTVAAADPGLFAAMARAAPGKINLALDCRGGDVLVDGWVRSAGRSLFDLLETTRPLPLGEIIYTEVENDGTGAGLPAESLAGVVAASPHPVIASGGAASLADVEKALAAGAFGIILGRALYDARIDLAHALEIAQRKGEQ